MYVYINVIEICTLFTDFNHFRICFDESRVYYRIREIIKLDKPSIVKIQRFGKNIKIS